MSQATSPRATITHGSARGFTLIEVLVVVAIIGILAAVAYPSYAAYVARGRRADAQKALLEAAQYMQRYYVANNTYAKAGTDDTPPTLPSGLDHSPNSGSGSKAYSLTVATATATDYTLKATPEGVMANDECGTLTLMSTGVRKTSGLTVDRCWK